MEIGIALPINSHERSSIRSLASRTSFIPAFAGNSGTQPKLDIRRKEAIVRRCYPVSFSIEGPLLHSVEWDPAFHIP